MQPNYWGWGQQECRLLCRTRGRKKLAWTVSHGQAGWTLQAGEKHQNESNPGLPFGFTLSIRKILARLSATRTAWGRAASQKRTNSRIIAWEVERGKVTAIKVPPHCKQRVTFKENFWDTFSNQISPGYWRGQLWPRQALCSIESRDSSLSEEWMQRSCKARDRRH